MISCIRVELFFFLFSSKMSRELVKPHCLLWPCLGNVAFPKAPPIETFWKLFSVFSIKCNFYNFYHFITEGTLFAGFSSMLKKQKLAEAP
jgi:hypothetical protein